MTDQTGAKPPADPTGYPARVGAKAARKDRARRTGRRGVWFGLGMMGLIGWSVAVPTILGAVLGRWLDARDAGGRPWTLMLLVAGLFLGCANAWNWIAKEDRAMREEEKEDDDG